MPQVVENLLAAILELFDALAHAFVWRQQRATQHTLLGLRRMRRQPVHGRAALLRGLLSARLFQISRGPAVSETESIISD